MAVYPPRGSTPWDLTLKEYVDDRVDASEAGSTTDLGVADKVENGPLTQAALSATIVAEAPRPTFFHDFRDKPDHTIVDGELSDSGHAFTARGVRDFIVSGGVLTMVHTEPAGAEAAYLLAGMIRAWVKVLDDYTTTAADEPIATATVAISQDPFDADLGFSDAAAHCSWNHTTNHGGADVPEIASMRYDYFTAGGAGATPIFRGQFPHLEVGTEYKIEVNLRDKQATVVLPNGDTIRSANNDEILARRGPHAMWEIYVPSGGATHRRIGFTRIEAETIDRANQGRGPTSADIAQVRERPGRLLGFEHSTGNSVATAMTTSLSATSGLHKARFAIPRSHRVLIEGWSWFEIQSPATPNTLAQLMLGGYVDGNSSYGKLTTVWSGQSPANNSADPKTGSKTHDWASIADGAFASTTVPVTGCILGDTATASMNIAVPAGMQLTASVTTADTVTVTLFNHSGSAQDLASGTLRAKTQGITTGYSSGSLLPWALLLDIDPIFMHGDLRNIQVRGSCGSTGGFTFIDSGIGGGAGSTIRRSSLKITDAGY
jgi:hypothetical protein